MLKNFRQSLIASLSLLTLASSAFADYGDISCGATYSYSYDGHTSIVQIQLPVHQNRASRTLVYGASSGENFDFSLIVERNPENPLEAKIFLKAFNGTHFRRTTEIEQIANTATPRSDEYVIADYDASTDALGIEAGSNRIFNTVIYPFSGPAAQEILNGNQSVSSAPGIRRGLRKFAIASHSAPRVRIQHMTVVGSCQMDNTNPPEDTTPPETVTNPEAPTAPEAAPVNLPSDQGDAPPSPPEVSDAGAAPEPAPAPESAPEASNTEPSTFVTPRTPGGE